MNKCGPGLPEGIRAISKDLVVVLVSALAGRRRPLSCCSSHRKGLKCCHSGNLNEKFPLCLAHGNSSTSCRDESCSDSKI